MARPIFTVRYGGLPWQTRTSCLSDPKNRQTNPIYGVLAGQTGGSPSTLSTQNHQNNYGQAFNRVPKPRNGFLPLSPPSGDKGDRGDLS